MIAVIPARGGSKGLPGKNIKMLCGKPLIAYTIEAAKKAHGIERVFVTTDSEDIAKVAVKYGAEIPFIRPVELAQDYSLAKDVYIHMIEHLKKEFNFKENKFMVLLPTAPMRNSSHIEEALNLFYEKNADTLISMTLAETPVSWYYLMNEKGIIQNAGFDKSRSMANRQENQKYYIPNGAIYILDYKLLKEMGTYYSDNTYAYIMSKKDSIDIDTEVDFDYAEYLINNEYET
jgi:N-acylneuraminate cytidylyltransferase/CMP-N,N'-diacetyllegionaminic acid synthase